MLLELGERETSGTEQEDIIQDFFLSSSKLMVALEEKNSSGLAGFLVTVGSTARRNRHSLHCVLGIEQNFTGAVSACSYSRKWRGGQ
jgi:hypothetical protein